MQADILLCCMEKFRHLRLRKPDGLIFYPDCYVKFCAFRLVNDYLILVGSGRTDRNIFLHRQLLWHTSGKKRQRLHTCALNIDSKIQFVNRPARFF
jgi:hypothetical protein